MFVSMDNAGSKTCEKQPNSAPLRSIDKDKNVFSSPQPNVAGRSESAGVSANWIAIVLNYPDCQCECERKFNKVLNF